MRVGCSGCLTTLGMLGLFGAVAAGGWGLAWALQDPGRLAVASTHEDAARAQQKIFGLVTGTARETVVFTEAEVNAILARNVDPRDLPVDEASVLLRADNMIEIAGRVSVRRFLAQSSLRPVADVLPASWLARRVVLRFIVQAEFEPLPRRHLRLDVREVTVGQQRLPTFTLSLLIEPERLRSVRIALPDGVAGVRIESGRALIQPTSSPGRT